MTQKKFNRSNFVLHAHGARILSIRQGAYHKEVEDASVVFLSWLKETVKNVSYEEAFTQYWNDHKDDEELLLNRKFQERLFDELQEHYPKNWMTNFFLTLNHDVEKRNRFVKLYSKSYKLQANQYYGFLWNDLHPALNTLSMPSVLINNDIMRYFLSRYVNAKEAMSSDNSLTIKEDGDGLIEMDFSDLTNSVTDILIHFSIIDISPIDFMHEKLTDIIVLLETYNKYKGYERALAFNEIRKVILS